MKLSLAKDLTPLRAAAKVQIDSDAEAFRLNFITPGAGQALAYQQKYEEAVEFILDPSLDASEVPHIYAEVGVTGSTPEEVASVVIGMRTTWKHISAVIEYKRAAAKAAVDAATNPAAIRAAAEVNWNDNGL